MPTLRLLIAIAATLAAVAAGIFVRRLLAAGLRFRGSRVVTCPETQRAAGVTLDLWYAVITAFGGKPRLRLSGCSRWPERAPCGQECLSEIQAAPGGCRVQALLRDWYEDKCCLWCGAPVSPVHWSSCKPVLLTSAGQLQQWNEIPVDRVPEVLGASQPVCFACYARRLAAVTPAGRLSELGAASSQR
jgi:hypothetical protein